MTGSHQTDLDFKRCCADVYASDWVSLLLGDSLHPGGLALTRRLGELAGLRAGARVLDVAAGRGASAIHLAEQFGCDVVGVDFGDESVTLARAAAASSAAADRVRFEQADAERLPFADKSFDAVVCECAFCTFPDKAAAAREFARVLRPGGRAGLSDLMREGALPDGLQSFAARVACIADALPTAGYAAHLERAGLAVDHVERHDDALASLVDTIRGRLMGAKVLATLKGITLPGVDIDGAAALARQAAAAVRAGTLGYGLILARRPISSEVSSTNNLRQGT